MFIPRIQEWRSSDFTEVMVTCTVPKLSHPIPCFFSFSYNQYLFNDLTLGIYNIHYIFMMLVLHTSTAVLHPCWAGHCTKCCRKLLNSPVEKNKPILSVSVHTCILNHVLNPFQTLKRKACTSLKITLVMLYFCLTELQIIKTYN